MYTTVWDIPQIFEPTGDDAFDYEWEMLFTYWMQYQLTPVYYIH